MRKRRAYSFGTSSSPLEGVLLPPLLLLLRGTLTALCRTPGSEREREGRIKLPLLECLSHAPSRPRETENSLESSMLAEHKPASQSAAGSPWLRVARRESFHAMCAG